MSEKDKNEEARSGKEFSDTTDDLIGKSKAFADKAEDFLEETVGKVKNSDAFEKISGLFGKVEGFMEEKSEEFQRGEMGAKFEAFKDKAGEEADELWKKAKDAGRKLGDQFDESLDSIKRKKDTPKNQDGAGI